MTRRQFWIFMWCTAIGLVAAVAIAGTTIDFSAPITAGGGAAFPLLNQSTYSMPSDANYTPTQSQLAAIKHYVQSSVSLGSPRNLTYPTVKGLIFQVSNLTTGGQTITVKTSGGTGVAIPNGSSAWIECDGTNYNNAGSGGGGSSSGPDIDGGYVVGWEGQPLLATAFQSPSSSCVPVWNGTQWTNNVPTLTGDCTGQASNNSTATVVKSATGNGLTNDWDSGVGFFGVTAGETCLASATGHKTCTTALGASTNDSTTFVTLGQIVPPVNSISFCQATCTSKDLGTDGGVQGNAVKCQLDFLVTNTSSGKINMTSQAGLNGPSTVSVPLACIAATGASGASDAYDSGIGTQTPSHTFQLITSGGNVVKLQAKGTNTNTWILDCPISCEPF